MTAQQQEKTVMITGASSGIGLELTRKWLEEGWNVIALNRSDFPSEDQSLKQAFLTRRLRPYRTSDLADFSSLSQTLNEIKSKERRIDILFNNAGGSFHELSYSRQGREKHYDLMTAAPYITIMALKELLMNGEHKTVINTSSAAIKYTKELSVEMLERPTSFRKLLGPYAASKLALSLWTQDVAPKLAEEGIFIRSVDPGGNNTLRKGKNAGLPLLIKPLMKLFFPPPTHGAGLLYEGAIGLHRQETGVYLQKNKITALPFQERAAAVSARIHAIYELEYLPIASSKQA